MTEKRFCPRCGAPREAGAVLCVQCGVHFASGRTIETGPDNGAEDEAPAPEAAAHPLQFLGTYLPGLFRVSVTFVSVLLFVVALGVGGLAIFVATLGAFLEAAFIGGAAYMLYATAVSNMISGEIGWLVNNLAEFDAPRWWIFLLFMGVPFGAMTVVYKLFIA